MKTPLSERGWSTFQLLLFGGSTAVAGFLIHGYFPAAAKLGSVLPLHEQIATPLPTPAATARLMSAESAPVADQENFPEDSRARTPQTDARRAHALEQLAKENPQKALALALAENNALSRQRFRDAVLKVWASSSPDEAATWVLHELSQSDRISAMDAVFSGAAARDPASAVSLADKIYSENAGLPADYGQLLIQSLAQNGAFTQAAEFALHAPARANQPAWVNAAFTQWAMYQPAEASSAISAIVDPNFLREARLGLIEGWSSADPSQLAEYAKQMAPSEERSEAMQAALIRWVGADPVAASTWIDGLEPGPDLDHAAVAIASTPAVLSKNPETALSWATSITNADLRKTTLRALAIQLSTENFGAARQLVASSSLANSSDREAFASGVQSPPPFR